jgi:hypothetical protein
MTTFTRDMLTTFVHMPSSEWRSLTVAMGVMYRVRLNKETHIVDQARRIFGEDIPTRQEWEVVKDKVNKVRRQVLVEQQKLDEQNGVATNESPRIRKRNYQRDYMRKRRKDAKAQKAQTMGN